MAAAKTRSFTVPAGTVINTVTVPETITAKITYSPSETTSGAAQKEALRRVQAELARRFHITAPLSHIQRATKQRHTEVAPRTVRGGRTPERLKVAGGFTDKGEKKGVRIYRKGTERSRAGSVTLEDINQMVEAAFARHPGATVSVAAYGWGDPDADASPKRYKKDHPLGLYKRGDIMRRARHWGSTASVASAEAWFETYGETGNFAAQTQLDPGQLSRADVLVKLPEAAK